MAFFTRFLTGSLLGTLAGAALVRRSRRRMRFFGRRARTNYLFGLGNSLSRKRTSKGLRRMITRAAGVWRLFRGGRLLR